MMLTPALPQPLDTREQMLRVRLREAARRLVHDQHLRLAEQRAGDFDDLLLRDGELRAPAHRSGMSRMAKLRQSAPRRVRAGAAIDPAEPRRLGAEQRCFPRRSDAARDSAPGRSSRRRSAARACGSRGANGWPSSSIAPASGRVRAAEDLHQRALARAILADQRMDLARRDLERHAPQRCVAPKALRMPVSLSAASS